MVALAMLTTLLLSVLLGTSVQDHLDGAEIGDATQAVTFATAGKYHAERTDPKGTTSASGTWRVREDRLEVKISSCKGPACADLGKGFKADIALVADRAMTVKASPDTAPLSTGSYYCHYQGCEKRTGVELLTFGAPAGVMKYLVDFLIDKNRSRDVTVVWWGKRTAAAQATSSITWCRREEEKSKAGATLVAGDLGELPWVGKLEPKASAEADCLYDVRVVVGDAVNVPPEALSAAKARKRDR